MNTSLKKTIWIFLALAFLYLPGKGQQFTESDQITSEQAQLLRSLWSEVSFKWEKHQQSMQRKTDLQFGQTLLSDTLITVRFMGFSPTGEPIYYQTYNLFGAQSLNTHRLWTGGISELNLDGQGITLNVWDGGPIRHTHQEFGNRTTQMDTGGWMNGHATHVAGTMVAAGMVPTAKGMAPQAHLHTYTFTDDEVEMIEAAANGAILSNHSYGRPTGWVFHTNQWWWYGDTRISETEDYKFGFYSDETRIRDEITYLAPFYLQVHAAGNDRADTGPASGEEHNVYDYDLQQWIKSTDYREPDGGEDGYDAISTLVLGKNVLTIGSVADASEYTGPESVVLSSFSSTGPADDGRIKPDVVAKGQNLLSTWVDTNTSYAGLTGTSMAAPTITGSLGLIQQLNQRLYGNYLRASTLKALIIHTAREAGEHEGPDYLHGWGLADMEAAALILPEKDNTTIIQERNLVQNTVPAYTRNVFSTGNQPLVATLVWTDVPAEEPEPALNDRTPMLVNDLDLRITRVADGEVFYPWKLDPDNPAAPATKGDNVVDNVEKIQLQFPDAGQYIVEVSHKGEIIDPVNPTNKRQSFSLVISGVAERAIDLALANANVLVSGCNFDENTPAFIEVRNKGQQSVTDVVVYFEVKDSNNNIVSEGSLELDSLEAGFGEQLELTIDLSQGFEFEFKAWVNHPGDQLPANNTFIRNLVSESWLVSDEVYHESFEGIAYLEESGWQSINANDNNAGWMLRIADGPNQFASHGANSMRYGILNPSEDGTEVEEQADDWLISTCFYLLPGEIYRLSFDYRAWNADFPENMRVFIGQIPDPEFLTHEITDINSFSNEEFFTSMDQFTVEEEGSYFVGIQVYSDPDHRFIYLDNVFLERMVFSDIAAEGVEINAEACDFSAQTPVTVSFVNMGLDAQENFDVQLEVNHIDTDLSNTYVLSYTQLLGSEETGELEFLVDMSLYGAYALTLTTLLEDDERPENDVLEVNILNSLVDLESNSFFTNFDDIFGLDAINWTINNVNDDGFTWRFYTTSGQAYTPPHSINYYRSPGSGGAANDWLITNCLRMEEGEHYRIKFQTATKGSGDADEYYLYLMDGLEPQDTLSQFGYVTVNTFDYVEREFIVQAPSTGIFHIGFYVNSTLPNALQFFVDDVTIEKVPEKDAAVRAVVQEVYGCNSFTTETPVTVVYKNRGTLPLENITLELSVTDEQNNTTVYSEALPSGLPMGQKDTISFEIDLSILNTIYTLTAEVIMDGDADPDNDTKTVLMRNTTVDLTAGHEYFNDFEMVHVDGGNALIDPKLGWWYENTNEDFYSSGLPITWLMRDNAPFAHSGTISMRAGRSTIDHADDWLFSNCFIMQEGENYLMNFYYTGRAASTTEKMSVHLGTDQDSQTMGDALWDETFNTALNYQKGVVTFSPPADGTYYVGFYHYSEPDQGWIYFDDFSIQRNYDLDVSLDSITVMADACGFSEETPLRISIRNSGNEPFSYPVTINYTVTDPQGNVAITGEQTIDQTMNVNDVVYYDFFADLRKYGEYQVEASVSLPESANESLTENNFKAVSVRNTSMFPHVENLYLPFEEFSRFEETGFVAFDLNGDGFTWDLGVNFTNFAFSGNRVMYYSFSASNDADDWLFSSCAHLQAGTVYNVSYYYRVYAGDYPEDMKFGIASEQHPDALIEFFDEKEEMDNYNYRRISYAFTVPEDGQYYFAWYAHSPKYHRFIFFDDLSLRIAPEVDGTVRRVVPADDPCDFGEETAFEATLVNLGSQELPAGTLDVTVNSPGGTQQISVNTPVLPVLGTAQVEFAASVVEQERHMFQYKLEVPGDQVAGNNQGSMSLYGIHVDLTQPGSWFIQDFETIFALREIGWSIFNLNNDNRYWGLRVNDPPLAHSGHNYLVYFTGNTTQAANDWVISSCYELSHERKYKAAFFYRLGSGNHNMRLAVGSNPLAEEMTQIIWEQTQMSAPSDQPYMHVGDVFEVAETGRYYFGIQQFSPANQGSSLADDLVIIAQPDILPVETEMVPGTEITLHALASDSLKWYADEDLTQVIGEGLSLTVTVTNEIVPVYAAEFVYGVTGPADVVLVGPGTGIDQNILEDLKLLVYPNPATDHINLILPSVFSEKLEMKIVNVLGDVVLQQTIHTEDDLRIDVSQLARGSYFIILQNRNVQMQQGFVRF